MPIHRASPQCPYCASWPLVFPEPWRSLQSVSTAGRRWWSGQERAADAAEKRRVALLVEGQHWAPRTRTNPSLTGKPEDQSPRELAISTTEPALPLEVSAAE